ncbi:N utilization substance protein B-like [Spatholobus suberectus]|nr:N utilization substance protein B-like [Spatholobus suberectus]
MEGVLLPVCCSPSSCATPSPKIPILQRSSFPSSLLNHRSFPQNAAFSLRNSFRSSTFAIAQGEAPVLGKTDNSLPALPKIDKTGRFCSPRAARELALSIIYAACLEGLDPVRLFEKRMNARREAGYEFNKEKLLEYNHMSFGGPPVTVESDEEANELLRHIEEESAIEAEVLTAPPKLVYNKLMLRFTKKLLVAVRDTWDSHVLVINKIVPPNWKNEPAGKILELSILHLAMSEMAVLETRHQIVINEAVDLAKRFCDGAAPRIINGCLRTFVRELELEASNNRV